MIAGRTDHASPADDEQEDRDDRDERPAEGEECDVHAHALCDQAGDEAAEDLQKAIRKKDGEKLHSFFSRTRLIRKKIIDAGQS